MIVRMLMRIPSGLRMMMIRPAKAKQPPPVTDLVRDHK